MQSPLPITQGRLLDFSEDPISCMRRLWERHGNICALEEHGQRLVFVFGPEWNQKLLSDAERFHTRFFAIRGPRNSAQRRLTSGMLSINGEEHRRDRRIVKGPFEKKSIVRYHDAICELTRNMLDGWRIGQVRDMHAEMTEFMLRLTSAMLFGVDEPELALRIGRMIDRWVEMNHVTGMGAFLSHPTINADYERLLSLAERLEAEIRKMIELRRPDRNGKRSTSEADVLSLLIHAHDADSALSDEKLIGHVALLFGAAHLTTAHTLTWTLFLLAQHPSVMREVDAELGSKLHGDQPDADQIDEFPVTERALKESMRILPASGSVHRIAAVPVELGPFRLSKGSVVVFSQYMTHHLPELYPEPKTFRPDRWLEISPSPYAYLPFGAGPRMCIGGPLAMRTLKTVLPMILKRYRLSMLPGTEVSGKIVSTMLGPTTPVRMLISPADGRFQAQPVTGNVHSMVDLRESTPMRKAA